MAILGGVFRESVDRSISWGARRGEWRSCGEDGYNWQGSAATTPAVWGAVIVLAGSLWGIDNNLQRKISEGPERARSR